MRLKARVEMGSTFICLILPLTPLTATSTLLRISKEILVLMLFMTSLYFSLVLAASFTATLFRNLVASGPIPPVVVKTRGENVPFSTCSIPYIQLQNISLCFGKAIPSQVTANHSLVTSHHLDSGYINHIIYRAFNN